VVLNADAALALHTAPPASIKLLTQTNLEMLVVLLDKGDLKPIETEQNPLVPRARVAGIC